MGCRELFMFEGVDDWFKREGIEFTTRDEGPVHPFYVYVSIFKDKKTSEYYVVDYVEAISGGDISLYACDDLTSAKELMEKLLSEERFE